MIDLNFKELEKNLGVNISNEDPVVELKDEDFRLTVIEEAEIDLALAHVRIEMIKEIKTKRIKSMIEIKKREIEEQRNKIPFVDKSWDEVCDNYFEIIQSDCDNYFKNFKKIESEMRENIACVKPGTLPEDEKMPSNKKQPEEEPKKNQTDFFLG